jgi:hypothetical protein
VAPDGIMMRRCFFPKTSASLLLQNKMLVVTSSDLTVSATASIFLDKEHAESCSRSMVVCWFLSLAACLVLNDSLGKTLME